MVTLRAAPAAGQFPLDQVQDPGLAVGPDAAPAGNLLLQVTVDPSGQLQAGPDGERPLARVKNSLVCVTHETS